ncbi:MAG: single-stranded DNA-binding protein [Bacteroidales bacterium]|nr:single-stranded DNA-binding protein [Bacteroidales bacterium]
MINKVILIGNAGADPEVRYIKEDQPVANIRLATTERGFKRQDGTEVPERTEWHRLTVWGHSAKFAELYIKKGDQLYVEGRLHYSQYQDKNNETRYSTEIIVDELRKLGRRTDSNGILDQQQSQTTMQPQSVAPVRQQTAEEIVAEAQNTYMSQGDTEEDLPF